MIVIKAGSKIIINPAEIYVTLTGSNRYGVGAMTSSAFGDTLLIWPLEGSGASEEEAKEMLGAIFKAITRHFKSTLPHVHVDIKLVEEKLKEKKSAEAREGMLEPLCGIDNQRREQHEGME